MTTLSPTLLFPGDPLSIGNLHGSSEILPHNCVCPGKKCRRRHLTLLVFCLIWEMHLGKSYPKVLKYISFPQVSFSPGRKMAPVALDSQPV